MEDFDKSDQDPVLEARKELDPDRKLCGNCAFWHATHRDYKERWVGPCRVIRDRGDIPLTSAPCDRFMKKGGRLPGIMEHREKTRRRSRVVKRTAPILRKNSSEKSPSEKILGGRRITGESGVFESAMSGGFIPDPEREVEEMTQQELLDVLQDFFGGGPLPRMARKWEGGSLLLKPEDENLQPREIPLDVFFKKLVRVRDQIRLLEQKINGHDRLTGSEKLELHTYLTRCYGTLTTFNVLFADAEDRFVGDRGAS